LGETARRTVTMQEKGRTGNECSGQVIRRGRKGDGETRLNKMTEKRTYGTNKTRKRGL